MESSSVISAASGSSSSSMETTASIHFDDPTSQIVRLKLNEQICHTCGFEIHDRYLLRVINNYYHESCLRCASCEKSLTPSNTCFVKENQVFCKDDHMNFFVPKCSRCLLPLRANDLVQRSRQHTYHSSCFHCIYCGKHLKPGDEYFCIDSQIICQNDYNFMIQNGQLPQPPLPHGMMHPLLQEQQQLSDFPFPHPPPHPLPPFFPELDPHHRRRNNSNKKPPKRPRTILNSSQRKAFKIAFEKGSKPTKKVREQLASETGLSVRVVQVWFQNQRAKIKKIERKQGKLHNSNSDPSAPGSETNGLSPDCKSDDIKSPLSLKSDDDSDDFDDIIVDSGRSSATIQRQNSSSSFFSTDMPEKDPMDKLYHMHSTYFAFA